MEIKCLCAQHVKRFWLLFIVTLFLCTWVIIERLDKPAILRPLFYAPQKDNIYEINSTSWLEEVTVYDIKHWQEKFYTSLAKIRKRPPKKWKSSLTRIMAYNVYNQGLLDNLTQIKLPRDELRRSVHLATNNGLLLFPETASCKPILPDVVLYNRIFKTGSETTGALLGFLGYVMDYFYTKQTTEDFYDQGISAPYPIIIERKVSGSNRLVLFNAHFFFRNNLDLKLRSHTYINQVREPVARFLSHYSYMRSTNRPKDRIQQMIDSGEWTETIEECFEKQSQGCKRNVMTRFFCGTDRFCKSDAPKALIKAKENILQHYAVVGLLEHYQITLKILQRRLPFFVPVVPRNPSELRVNEGVRGKNVSITDEMISKIKRANWADMELYDFIKERFWKQVRACGLS